MAESIREQEYVPTSKFYMFRCLVAMAHADGHFADSERAYIEKFMNHEHVPLDDEQRRLLLDDMQNPKNISDLLPYINDPKYRSQLPYFARIMAYKDGVLQPSEEQLLEHMHLSVTDGLDMDAIREDVHAAVQVDMNAHDIGIDKERPEGGLFGLFDQLMLALGLDLMRE